MEQDKNKTKNEPTPEDLLAKGEELFGSKVRFDHWMNCPNSFFGEIKPYYLMFESGGIKKIYQELIRLEFGVF
ncbi:antitoxin Xre/MbcA/ParS toxin-binding domain-containing protein [Marinifilum sp.]|uniref:antitoxin Xre/MbcA/ParS toxin-binding domain-containing protein n=1 Tax=Marinifilum sp. TaxID=2033137 RepID=UPI003BABD951